MILDGVGLRGLDHVGLTVPDLDEALAYFTDVFGAVEVLRHGAYAPRPIVNEVNFARDREVRVAGIAMIRVGDQLIELLEYVSAASAGSWPSTSARGGHHLSFYVDDLDAAVDRLRSAGVDVLGEPLDMGGAEAGPGNRFVYLRAPWGLFLELVTYPDGKANGQLPPSPRNAPTSDDIPPV